MAQTIVKHVDNEAQEKATRRDGSGHREMVVDSLMDAVAGARRTPGRLETGGVPSKPPATILLSVPLGVLGLRFALPEAVRRHLLRAVAAAVFSFLSWRRLRHRVAAQASRTSHCDVSAPPDVEASRITSWLQQACLFLQSTFSLSLLERLPRKHCQVVSPFSKLTFKVALPPSCLRCNFDLFFMTLFTGGGRHHSSSHGGEGQCCQVEQLRLEPSWDTSLWAHTAPLGFSGLRLSFRSPAVAVERASFLVPLTALPSSTSSTLTVQSNSENVSFGMPGRAWQDVSTSFTPVHGLEVNTSGTRTAP